MENPMTLHEDKNMFFRAIKEVSDGYNIPDYFIEKDYWLSLVLKRLSESKYVDSFVFKGGTSLSKGFKLINRFSEDVDIAVINVADMTGNKIKTLIRTVEKEIARDLKEVELEGITSKGSRFRKALYEYPEIQALNTESWFSNSLTIEINSFANPYPYIKRNLQSYIGEYLQQSKQDELIDQYGLKPFEINILDKNRTFIEKLVSLIRFSFGDNPHESLSDKVRHFYDIYYLKNDTVCKTYLNSTDFLQDLKEVIEHDKKLFKEPLGWNEKLLKDSPLINDFKGLWDVLKESYEKELFILAFTKIPSEKAIADNFKNIITVIKKFKE